MPIAEVSASNGALLKVLRATQDLSQKTLSQTTLISVAKIWAIENNVAVPTKNELAKIWTALSTD